MRSTKINLVYRNPSIQINETMFDTRQTYVPATQLLFTEDRTVLFPPEETIHPRSLARGSCNTRHVTRNKIHGRAEFRN